LRRRSPGRLDADRARLAPQTCASDSRCAPSSAPLPRPTWPRVCRGSRAREAAAHKATSFVYISAAGGAPILPGRYITTKREAESIIASSFPELRSIFIRPGFLYDASRMFTIPLAYMVFPFNTFNSLIGGRLSALAGAAVEKPLRADDVANAVIEAIEDESMKGPVLTGKIEELATKAWRRGML